MSLKYFLSAYENQTNITKVIHLCPSFQFSRDKKRRFLHVYIVVKYINSLLFLSTNQNIARELASTPTVVRMLESLMRGENVST